MTEAQASESSEQAAQLQTEAVPSKPKPEVRHGTLYALGNLESVYLN